MNELLRALGVELFIDEISIKLQTVKILIEASKPVQPTPYGSITGISSYLNTPIYIPHVYWSFETEFGQQYHKYNANQMSKQQAMLYPNYPWGGLSTSGPWGISGSSSGISSGVSLQQQMQQQAAQSPFTITSSGTSLTPTGQLILQSPSAQVVIKNLDTEEEKKSWFQQLKDMCKWKI